MWHYSGVGGPSSSPTNLCYSSWGSFWDTAHTATFQASAPWHPDTHKSAPITGFYCLDKYGTCYVSGYFIKNPYWMANLGIPRRITTIKIQTRRELEKRVKFEDVEVRVGEDATDFGNNQVFGYYEGEAMHGEVITFKATTTTTFITGSIVTLQAMTSYELVICSIQILYV